MAGTRNARRRELQDRINRLNDELVRQHPEAG